MTFFFRNDELEKEKKEIAEELDTALVNQARYDPDRAGEDRQSERGSGKESSHSDADSVHSDEGSDEEHQNGQEEATPLTSDHDDGLGDGGDETHTYQAGGNEE